MWFNLAPGRGITLVDGYESLRSFNEFMYGSSRRKAGKKKREATVVPSVRYVGIDAEWPAFSGMHNKGVTECSILQIACADRVFVFDMRVLSPYPFRQMKKKDAQLSELARRSLFQLFNDPNIVKVGWDFNKADLQVLQAASQGYFRACFTEINSLLDLQTLLAAYKSDYALETDMQALSRGCEYFLGRKVNKFEQLSNWDERPLMASQLSYAALDAHVLLAVLDAVLISINAETVSGASLAQYPPSVADYPRSLCVGDRKALFDEVEGCALQLSDISIAPGLGGPRGPIVEDKVRNGGGNMSEYTWKSFIRNIVTSDASS